MSKDVIFTLEQIAAGELLNASGVQVYQAAVEKLLARARVVCKSASIREQMNQAYRKAAQKNTVHPKARGTLRISDKRWPTFYG